MSPAAGQGSKRILITGAAGMLGSELLLTAPNGFEAFGTDLRAAPAGSPRVADVGTDLTDADAVEALFQRHGPFAAVIHGAAYTAVDKAEDEAALAERVNTVAPAVLAAACARRELPLVVVSTDFVFDGTGTKPYREDDAPQPLGVYGRTKYAGEQAAREAHPAGTRIVRTQWLYGPRGNHFPGTMLRLAAERDRLQVVDDQVGSPTSTLELAPALWDVLRLGAAPGVYHASCEGSCSWHGLAAATLELAGLHHVAVEPCTTAQFPRPAPRPAYSVLDCSRLTALRGRALAPWREALAAFLKHESLLTPQS